MIECESRSAYIDELNVYVGCQVRARPSLTSLFWVVDVNGTMVSGGEVTNEYWSVVVVSISSNILVHYRSIPRK